MNPRIKELAEKADFIFWSDESWGPGEGHIDWSTDYDESFQKYTELLIRECAEICLEANDHKNILRHFGIE